MTNPQHTHKAKAETQPNNEFAWLDDLLADLYGYSIGIDNLNSDQKKVKFIDAQIKIITEIKKREQSKLEKILKNGHGGGNWRRLIMSELTQPTTDESEVEDV